MLHVQLLPVRFLFRSGGHLPIYRENHRPGVTSNPGDSSASKSKLEKLSSTCVPIFCAVVALGDVMNALSVASEEQDSEFFRIVNAVQMLNMLLETLPLGAYLAIGRIAAVLTIDQAEIVHLFRLDPTGQGQYLDYSHNRML